MEQSEVEVQVASVAKFLPLLYIYHNAMTMW